MVDQETLGPGGQKYVRTRSVDGSPCRFDSIDGHDGIVQQLFRISGCVFDGEPGNSGSDA